MLAAALALASTAQAEPLVIEAGNGRVARIAPNILREHELETLVHIISSMEADLTKLDSTDRLPAFETYVRNDGKDKHPDVASLTPLWERLTQFARDKYAASCPECFLCSVLLRRYKQEERTRVHSHFDRNALVTAVASLNAGNSPPSYVGGLFLQRTARATSREFIDANRTDAVFHDYGLNHGVDVQSGTRYSAVFWFSDSVTSCREGRSPWYETPAADGDMNAQEALAELYQVRTVSVSPCPTFYIRLPHLPERPRPHHRACPSSWDPQATNATCRGRRSCSVRHQLRAPLRRSRSSAGSSSVAKASSAMRTRGCDGSR